MQKTPVSIRVIYILTSIIYYLSAISCLFAVILCLTIITGLFKMEHLQLHIDMPVKVNFEEIGIAYFDGKEIDVEVVEATGKVHFIDTPPKLARRLAIPLLIIFPSLFWLVYLFHRFMRNVSEGRYFEKRNFQLLRMLGYSLMGLWLIIIIYMQIIKYTLVNHFTFDLIEISNDGRWFAGIFAGGLFTLVLAQIFLKGRELEIENELTI
jgi:hypothetical protein